MYPDDFCTATGGRDLTWGGGDTPGEPRDLFEGIEQTVDVITRPLSFTQPVFIAPLSPDEGPRSLPQRGLVVSSRPASPDTWMESKLDEAPSSPTTASVRDISSRGNFHQPFPTVRPMAMTHIPAPQPLLLPHTATSQRMLELLSVSSPQSFQRSVNGLQAAQSHDALLDPFGRSRSRFSQFGSALKRVFRMRRVDELNLHEETPADLEKSTEMPPSKDRRLVIVGASVLSLCLILIFSLLTFYVFLPHHIASILYRAEMIPERMYVSDITMDGFEVAFQGEINKDSNANVRLRYPNGMFVYMLDLPEGLPTYRMLSAVANVPQDLQYVHMDPSGEKIVWWDPEYFQSKAVNKKLIGKLYLSEIKSDGRKDNLTTDGHFELLKDTALLEFCVGLLKGNSVPWLLEGPADVMIGKFTFKNLDFSKIMVVNGVPLMSPSSRESVMLEGAAKPPRVLELEAITFLNNMATSENLPFQANALLHNQGNLAIDNLGASTFSLIYGGSPVATLYAESLPFQSGRNSLSLTGTFDTKSPQLSRLISTFISNQPADVIVESLPEKLAVFADQRGPISHRNAFSAALEGLALPTTLMPGPDAESFLTGVRVLSAELLSSDDPGRELRGAAEGSSAQLIPKMPSRTMQRRRTAAERAENQATRRLLKEEKQNLKETAKAQKKMDKEIMKQLKAERKRLAKLEKQRYKWTIPHPRRILLEAPEAVIVEPPVKHHPHFEADVLLDENEWETNTDLALDMVAKILTERLGKQDEIRQLTANEKGMAPLAQFFTKEGGVLSVAVDIANTFVGALRGIAPTPPPLRKPEEILLKAASNETSRGEEGVSMAPNFLNSISGLVEQATRKGIVTSVADLVEQLATATINEFRERPGDAPGPTETELSHRVAVLNSDFFAFPASTEAKRSVESTGSVTSYGSFARSRRRNDNKPADGTWQDYYGPWQAGVIWRLPETDDLDILPVKPLVISGQLVLGIWHPFGDMSLGETELKGDAFAGSLTEARLMERVENRTVDEVMNARVNSNTTLWRPVRATNATSAKLGEILLQMRGLSTEEAEDLAMAVQSMPLGYVLHETKSHGIIAGQNDVKKMEFRAFIKFDPESPPDLVRFLQTGLDGSDLALGVSNGRLNSNVRINKLSSLIIDASSLNQSIPFPAPNVENVVVQSLTLGETDEVTAKVVIHFDVNNSPVSLEVGPVFLDWFIDGLRMGPVTVPRVILRPGQNELEAFAGIYSRPSAFLKGATLLTGKHSHLPLCLGPRLVYSNEEADALVNSTLAPVVDRFMHNHLKMYCTKVQNPLAGDESKFANTLFNTLFGSNMMPIAAPIEREQDVTP